MTRFSMNLKNMKHPKKRSSTKHAAQRIEEINIKNIIFNRKISEQKFDVVMEQIVYMQFKMNNEHNVMNYLSRPRIYYRKIPFPPKPDRRTFGRTSAIILLKKHV